jgi:hypothetical protein
LNDTLVQMGEAWRVHLVKGEYAVFIPKN